METLKQWIPQVVDQVVEQFQPDRIILFGSVARGEEGPDSDLDLLVIFDHLEPGQRRELTARIMRVVRAPVAYDVFVTDMEEFEAKKNVNGTMAYWPAHEGVVVHDRAVA
ncbi:MAG: nucleotidyltransferase domain-containing protein [Acidimicrobiales bacterium]